MIAIKTFCAENADSVETVAAFCAKANLIFTPNALRYFAAFENKKIVGLASLIAISDSICKIPLLFVLPQFRGAFIGRNLAIRAIEGARKLHFQRLWVEESEVNGLSAKFFCELGFYESPLVIPNAQKKKQFCIDLLHWSQSATRSENLFQLFDFNRAWAKQMKSADALYFKKLAKLQAPDYLWIGCSDSRVPANQVVGLLPGELFVHRNMANVVAHSDLNALSVIQYAVDILKVKHIMVVGHLGCGGVAAALHKKRLGLADVWVRHVKDVLEKHSALIAQTPTVRQHDLLCKLNVLEQVANVAQTTVLEDAWRKHQNVAIHGWIYDLKDGQIHDLGCTLHASADLKPRYCVALAAISEEFLNF